MADATLRHARPLLAINALIYHLITLSATATSIHVLLSEDLGFALRQVRATTQRCLDLQLAYGYTNNFWPSSQAHFTLATAIEMVPRLNISVIYLLDWALLAYSHGLRLPRPLASKVKVIARALVVTIP